jgi:hypothetical protein
MNERTMDRQLRELLQQGLGLSHEQEDALWADFTARAARETAAWAAFAMGLALAGRQLRAAMPGSVWHGWFISQG